MLVELWIFGWTVFVVSLAIMRSRARRRAWKNQPGLALVQSHDPAFVGPLLPTATKDHPEDGDGDTRGRTEGGAKNVSDHKEDALPAVHLVPPDVAEFMITEFRAGVDICKVDLRYPHIEFVHWRSPGLAAMRFTDGSETLTVVFQGLDIVPFDSVFVRFDHPRKGPQAYLLSELMNAPESEISPQEAAFGRDTALDSKTSAIENATTPLEFADFDTSKECIEVFVPVDRFKSTNLSVDPLANGQDAQVLVDGRVVAILRGAVDAGLRNVKLVAVAQTAAA